MSEVLKENDVTPKKKGKGKSAKKFNRNPHNKFQKRFNMGGNGLTAIQQTAEKEKTQKLDESSKKEENSSSIGTPSTNVSKSMSNESQISSSSKQNQDSEVVDKISSQFEEIENFNADTNQWIRYPPILNEIMEKIMENEESSDIESYLSKCQETGQISILHDFLNMWSKSIEELLTNLRDTIPGPGMLGEIHYWRNLTRVLDAIHQELKQPQVEFTIQLLLKKAEMETSGKDTENNVLQNDVLNFTKQKSRVIKGAKEAKWNNKYMKIIEQPVKQIELSNDLNDIVLVIVALLKSLKNIYNISNFYKEARMVSFVDRLLETIKKKLQSKFSLQMSIYNGIRDYEGFIKEIERGKNIVVKFQENFFISKLMEKQSQTNNPMKDYLGDDKYEESKGEQDHSKYDENSEEQQQMSQSFYKKEGLDYLYFNRPGTAYNNPSAFAGTAKAGEMMNMMGTATRSQFFQGAGQSGNSIKPIEMINSKNAKSNSLIQQLWYERAQKTMKQFHHFMMLIEQFEYMGDMANRLSAEQTPQLKKSFKDEKNEKLKTKKYACIQDIKKFLELYQSYSIKDYDYWDYKQSVMFSLFVEKFEKEGNALEYKASQLILGILEEEPAQQQKKKKKTTSGKQSQENQHHSTTNQQDNDSEEETSFFDSPFVGATTWKIK